jgi:RNA polymerase sigma factor (sigma-70 family)
MLHGDYELAQAASRGDATARDWLAAKLTCVPRMVQQIHSRARALPANELPDLAQRVAAVVIRRLAEFHGRCPIEAWIYRICVLTMQSHRRESDRATGDAATEPAATGPTPIEQAISRERCQLLHRAIDAIGGAEAEVLRARHVLDEGFETIAARTGIGIATLRSRYYRAMERLRRILQMPPFLDADSA